MCCSNLNYFFKRMKGTEFLEELTASLVNQLNRTLCREGLSAHGHIFLCRSTANHLPSCHWDLQQLQGGEVWGLKVLRKIKKVWGQEKANWPWCRALPQVLAPHPVAHGLNGQHHWPSMGHHLCWQQHLEVFKMQTLRLDHMYRIKICILAAWFIYKLKCEKCLWRT